MAREGVGKGGKVKKYVQGTKKKIIF